MPVRLDSLLSEPQDTPQQVVHLADRVKNVGYPWDMPKEDISFHLKTTEYQREPIEAGIETFMNKILEGVATFPPVSKGLDVASQLFPKEKWDEMGKDALATFKSIPRFFLGATKVETDLRGPLTTEEQEVSQAAARLGGEVLKTYTRVPTAIIKAALPTEGESRIAGATRGALAPEETPLGYAGGEIAKKLKPDFWLFAGILGTGVELGAYLLPGQGIGKDIIEFNKDRIMERVIKAHLSQEGQDFVEKYPKIMDLLKAKVGQLELRPGVTVDAYISSRPFRMMFKNFIMDLRSNLGQAALPKRISVFTQPLTQDGFIINLIAQGTKVSQDLIPRLGNMIEEQRSQVGQSIFEPDTGDIEEMTKMAAEGKLKLNKSEDVFSEEAHQEFYPPEEYVKVKDYTELQAGGGITPQDQKGKPLSPGDPVKYEDNFGVIQDVFDDGTAQLKTIVGIKEVPMWELNKVKVGSLNKKEQSLIESIKGGELIKPKEVEGFFEMPDGSMAADTPDNRVRAGQMLKKKEKVTLPLAIRLKDGTVITEETANLHSDIITNKGINPDEVKDVGIMDKKGEYQATKLPDEKGGAPLEGLPEVPKEAMEKIKGLVTAVKETPPTIAKEELTSEILDNLNLSERELATKRILERKTIKKTAEELGEDPEDIIKSEKYLAEKIPELKTQLAEAKTLEESKLAEEFEQEMAIETNEVKKQLKGYLAGKLKFNLKSQGEYENLRLLNWLFAKEGERGYTPDEIVGELKGMGFQVESDDDVRALISSYFSKEIWDKAERAVIGIEKKAKAKLKAALDKPPSERKKIADEMRLEKLSVIAEQLTKLAEVAPRLITPKQIAYIHVLKDKNMLTDQQFSRLKKIFTGKRTLKVTTPTGKLKKKPVTKEEAAAFIEGMKEVVPKKPIITGQPPVIPRTKALVPSEWTGPFNDLTAFQAAPLSGLDPNRAAELVDGKPYGPVRKYIVEPAQEAERKWKDELKIALDNLTKVSKGMKSNSDESELVFKFVEKTLEPEEEAKITETIRKTADYLSQVYDDLLVRINEKRALLNKVPIQRRQDYITHIWELSLMDEFFQGLSNIPDDVINIPSYAKSNSPFFKFALARLGGKEFRLDAISAFESYVSRAYPVIYNTDVLKSARPLVDRLPSNAYKYFSQYLDETMALRPTQADKLIPKPLLHAISWLRQRMGKGAILGNIASVFNQLFTLPNSVSAIGPKFIASALLKMHRDEWRAFTEAHSKVLQSRIYEIDFDPTLLSKVDNALGFLIQTMDKEMVRIAWGAQFEKSLSKGMNFADAIKDADNIAFKTQSGFNATDLPPAFRSKIAGSFLQFQNTVNNGLNFLRFDIGKEEGKRGKWGVVKAALLWLGTLLVLNKVYRMLGIPTPIEEWSDIFPLTSMAEYGPPVAFAMPTAIIQRIFAKTPQDQTRANKALYRSAFLFLPAGNQVRKTLEGIWAASQGGKFDKKGRLLIPIRGIPEVIRAVAFGPYGTKAGQAYINRGFKPETGRNFIRRDNLLQRSREPLRRSKILTSGQ